MANTVKGDFPDLICSDCGEKGCGWKHNGPLVPKGELGNFCDFCWMQRNEAYDQGKLPQPLGVKPPGIPPEYFGKPLTVTTSSGSIYVLGLGGNGQDQHEVTICCERRGIVCFVFVRAKVLRLALGKTFWLKTFDEKGGHWCASRVISIIHDFIHKEEVYGKEKRNVDCFSAIRFSKRARRRSAIHRRASPKIDCEPFICFGNRRRTYSGGCGCMGKSGRPAGCQQKRFCNRIVI